MCDRFRCLPSQFLAEPAEVLRAMSIEDANGQGEVSSYGE